MNETHNDFAISNQAEKPVFMDPVSQRFFSMWCHLNDGISVQYVSHEEYTLQTHLLKRDSTNKRTLYVPIHMRYDELESVMLHKGAQTLIDTLLVPALDADDLTEKLIENVYGNDYEGRLLKDVLNIAERKKELAEVRMTGTIEEIVEKEIEISWAIQEGITYLPKSDPGEFYFPSELPEKLRFQCGSGSMLGAALLDELDIKYLIMDLADHAHFSLAVITSDNKVRLSDMRWSIVGTPEITADSLVKGDLIQLLHIPEDGVEIEFTTGGDQGLEFYLNELNGIRNKDKTTIKMRVYSPEVGKKLILYDYMIERLGDLSISNNAELALYISEKILGLSYDYRRGLPHKANALFALGRMPEVYLLLEKAKIQSPQDAWPDAMVGACLLKDKNYHGAVGSFQAAIIKDPANAEIYYGLIISLVMDDKLDEAVEAQKMLEILPQNSDNIEWVNKTKMLLGDD